jgi:hypothetical protein
MCRRLGVPIVTTHRDEERPGSSRSGNRTGAATPAPSRGPDPTGRRSNDDPRLRRGRRTPLRSPRPHLPAAAGTTPAAAHAWPRTPSTSPAAGGPSVDRRHHAPTGPGHDPNRPAGPASEAAQLSFTQTPLDVRSIDLYRDHRCLRAPLHGPSRHRQVFIREGRCSSRTSSR